MASNSRITEELAFLVRSAFPDLGDGSFELLESGWDNYVLVADGEIAFKIPRDAGQSDQLRKEVSLAGCLRDSPIPVPDFSFTGHSGRQFIAGYRYIHGDSLNSVSSLPGGMKNQLTDFLNYLLGKSSDKCVLDVLGIPDENEWKARYNGYKETIFSGLFDVLDDESLSIIAEKFQDFLENLTGTMKVSLIHGDLYRGNVLIDKSRQKVTGVIDWGTACFGDPAIDFAALAVDFGIDEVEDMLSGYAGPIDLNFRKRVEFYWQLEPTYGIMYFRGREEGAFEHLTGELKSRIRKGLY